MRNGSCGPVAAIGGAQLERMSTRSVVSLGRVEIGERAYAVAGVVAGPILRRRRQPDDA